MLRRMSTQKIVAGQPNQEPASYENAADGHQNRADHGQRHEPRGVGFNPGDQIRHKTSPEIAPTTCDRPSSSVKLMVRGPNAARHLPGSAVSSIVPFWGVVGSSKAYFGDCVM